MESQFKIDNDGQQVQTQDFAVMGEAGALADDRLLAEFLRLTPYSSGAVKTILPYRHQGNPSGATVQSGTGCVQVFPFRAVIGTRSDDASDDVKLWKDIRSAVFTSGNSLLPSYQVSIGVGPISGPNYSRWDLIYAIVTPDALGPSTTRKVKDPVTRVITPTAVNPTKKCSVTVDIIHGTEYDTTVTYPVFPLLPGDASGNYYIALAYVLVPSGYNGATVTGNRDIMDVAPVVFAGQALGLNSCGPADGQYLTTGAVQGSVASKWSPHNNGRGPAYLPPTMMGAQSLLIALDLSDANPANWSHINGATIDSRDWSSRCFRWSGHVSQLASDFAWNASSGARVVPNARVENKDPQGTKDNGPVGGFGQSFVVDSIAGTNTLGDATVSDITTLSQPAVVAIDGGMNIQAGASPAPMSANSALAIYCDLSDGGKLKLSVVGNPRARIFLWVDASAPFPNH